MIFASALVRDLRIKLRPEPPNAEGVPLKSTEHQSQCVWFKSNVVKAVTGAVQRNKMLRQSNKRRTTIRQIDQITDIPCFRKETIQIAVPHLIGCADQREIEHRMVPVSPVGETSSASRPDRASVVNHRPKFPTEFIRRLQVQRPFCYLLVFRMVLPLPKFIRSQCPK